MSTTPPASNAEFRARFARHFVFADPDVTDDQTKVMDSDIANAMNVALTVHNDELWDGTDEEKPAFLLLSAHFLALDLQAAGGLQAAGLGMGQASAGRGIVASRSVGNVSVNYQLPESLAGNPIFSQFMETNYGKMFLQMAVPRAIARVEVVGGWHESDTQGD
jgi:hypothetical protein